MYIWPNYSSHISLWWSARRLIMLTQVIDLVRPVSLKTWYSLCASVNSLVKVSRAKLGNQSLLPYYTRITSIPKATVAKMIQCTRFLNSVCYNFTLHFSRKLIAGCLLSNKVKVSSTYRNHMKDDRCCLVFKIRSLETEVNSSYRRMRSPQWFGLATVISEDPQGEGQGWHGLIKIIYSIPFLRTTYLLLMNDYTITKTRICDETPQYRGLVMKPVKLQNKYVSVLFYDLSRDRDHPQP